MSKNLNVAAAIIMLGLAAMGSANARALNHNQPYPGYAGRVSTWERAPAEAWHCRYQGGPKEPMVCSSAQ